MSLSDTSDLALFGAHVRAIRIRCGFSQEDLALRAGFDRAYYGRIERGETNLTLSKILKIAEVLFVRPQDLLSCYDSHGQKEKSG